MTEMEMRTLAVEALHKTANVFSNHTVAERLADPSADVSFDDLGLDSLDRVEWAIEIETQTGLILDPGVVSQFNGLADFVHYLTERTRDSAA